MARFYLACLLLLVGSLSARAQQAETPSRGNNSQRKPIDPAQTPAIIEAEIVIAEWSESADSSKTSAADLSGDSGNVTKRVADLEKQGQLAILHRVRLTTVDGQPGFVQLGERRPRVTGSQFFGAGGRGGAGGSGGGGFANSVSFESIGTLISVTPYVHTEGSVTLTLNIEKSGPRLRADSPVLSESPAGEKIRAESTGTLTIQTVMRVANGQTAVVAGLTGKENQYLVLASAKTTK